MQSKEDRSERRYHRSAPGPMRIRLQQTARRQARRLARLASGISDSGPRRRARKGIEVAPGWGRRRIAVAFAEYVSYVAAILLVLLVVRSVVVVIHGSAGHFPFGFNPDHGCKPVGYSCGVVSGIAMTFLTLAFGSVAFLFWRLSHVQYPYTYRAETRPREVVPTAGSIIGDVVGRDELCHVVMDDLRDRARRRPHLLVGGVGVGKTAVIVQLTKLLAANGAVPVPVRLRDAQKELRFNDLARTQFLAEVDDTLVASGEGDKVWRRLSKDDRIVVLADGLEEALFDRKSDQDRNTIIRYAVREAERQRLPLVVATRPHASLAGLGAAVVELEPLSEDAALEYIAPAAAGDVEHRLDWVVETADVVEAPLYLRIARQLYEQRLLARANPTRDDFLDTRGVDRVELRVRLMRTWVNALIEGYFHTELPLDRVAREATVLHLSAMACIGLMKDTLEVKFEDVPKVGPEPVAIASDAAEATDGNPTAGAAERPAGARAATTPYRNLMHALVTQLTDLGRPQVDVRLAAARGAQLELVETRGDRVRFPHSIMQAYLGSRLIEFAMQDDTYVDEALDDPGREFLAALVMHAHGSLVGGTYEPWHTEVGRLRDEAKRRFTDAKSLDLLAAALEIDSVDSDPIHQQIAEDMAALWPYVLAEDRTVEEAKLASVARFGEAARAIAARRDPQARRRELRPRGRRRQGRLDPPAYATLLDIARKERSYRIRLAAAQELGAGGDEAFHALQNRLRPYPGGLKQAPSSYEAWLRKLDDDADEEHRELVMRAWLAPLLVGSTDQRSEQAKGMLHDWLREVGKQKGGKDVLPLSLEVALAQGFKHAANRRRDHPDARAEARDHLQEQAREMLKLTRFWYTRLTLLHALTLWELKEEPEAGRSGQRRADAEAAVSHWQSVSGSASEHPFVAEAAQLAVLALSHQQPERFMWIDESGVVGRVGSRPTRRDAPRKHNLWIPPSTGWTVLHPRALRLLADVLLLLNLAERGKSPLEREQRLRRALRDDIPPCLQGYRSHLEPEQTVGMVRTFAPGSNCKKGCRFELCPYPPKGEQTYRMELSEAFCRRQQFLLGRRQVGPPPWHRTRRVAALKDFWEEMADRAQR